MCCNPENGKVDFEEWSAYKIQLHDTEWIVGWLSPKSKVQKKDILNKFEEKNLKTCVLLVNLRSSKRHGDHEFAEEKKIDRRGLWPWNALHYFIHNLNIFQSLIICERILLNIFCTVRTKYNFKMLMINFQWEMFDI